MTRLAITGPSGRMGSRLVAVANQSDQFEVVAALKRDASESFGAVDVLIDFTSPAGMRYWLNVCQNRKIPLLSGSTGLCSEDTAELERASRVIPILHATNTSLGVAITRKVAAEITKQLGPDYDIEIVEMHHRMKKDAPSGTAKTIAESISAARGGADITMHSLRGGDEVGRHTIYFSGTGERIELTHRATNRDVFVHGALRAAAWLAKQKPGRYTIDDVLNA